MDEKKRKTNDVIVVQKDDNGNKEESEEEIVNRLQKQIEKSKIIEEQLDEQLRAYMSKVEELAEEGEFNAEHKGNENDENDKKNNNNVNEDDIGESYKGSDNGIGNNEVEY